MKECYGLKVKVKQFFSKLWLNLRCVSYGNNSSDESNMSGDIIEWSYCTESEDQLNIASMSYAINK